MMTNWPLDFSLERDCSIREKTSKASNLPRMKRTVSVFGFERESMQISSGWPAISMRPPVVGSVEKLHLRQSEAWRLECWLGKTGSESAQR